MGAMASQITSLTIVYSTVYSDADQRKHQSSASLAFVRGIYRGPLKSPHKWPVTGKIFPFHDVIMQQSQITGPFVWNCNSFALFGPCTWPMDRLRSIWSKWTLLNYRFRQFHSTSTGETLFSGLRGVHAFQQRQAHMVKWANDAVQLQLDIFAELRMEKIRPVVSKTGALAHGKAHMAQMGKCPWRSKTTNMNH